MQHLTRLKRLIAFSNEISDLHPIFDLAMTIEIDLERNQIQTNKQLESAIVKKKEILIFNLNQN